MTGYQFIIITACACSSQCREEAGIADVAFLAHQNYEEELLPKFVAAAASVTGRCLHIEASYHVSHFEDYT